MTEEQQKKIKNKLTVLTFGIIFLLAVLLIVLAATKKMSTIWFPIGAGTLLALYWVVADVLPVIWLRQFADKTESQKRSYYIYALIDAVGLAGLLYFIMSLTSMTGALVYVASVFMKKRFHDEYLGVNQEEAESEEEPKDSTGAGDSSGIEGVPGIPEVEESTGSDSAEDSDEPDSAGKQAVPKDGDDRKEQDEEEGV